MSHLVKQVVLYRLSRVQSYIMIGLRMYMHCLSLLEGLHLHVLWVI